MEIVKNAPPELLIELYLMHSVPLLLLLIDWYLHAPPFVLRHLPLLMLIGMIYMGVNIYVTLMTDRPVYPVFTWKDQKSFELAAIVGAG